MRDSEHVGYLRVSVDNFVGYIALRLASERREGCAATIGTPDLVVNVYAC